MVKTYKDETIGNTNFVIRKSKKTKGKRFIKP